ncbi:hypothetical protein HYV84_00620 [Candidatus Woesearchaeota archaeon]|nr:hypothetical protein [Candidatus Woesearchaeota archaeon]
MGLIGKSFAFVMIPLGLLLLLKQWGFLTLAIPFNILFLSAGLLAALEIITLIMVFWHYGKPSFFNLLIAAFSIIVAVGAVMADSYGFYPKESAIALGVVSIFVGVHALH